MTLQRLAIFAHSLFQGHSNLNHWPELIYRVTDVLNKASSRDMPVLAGQDSVVEPQLIHCFQTLCLATKRLYKNNFLHNLAAAGFHLCYVLRVRVCFRNHAEIHSGFARETFTCLKISVLCKRSCEVVGFQPRRIFLSIPNSCKLRCLWLLVFLLCFSWEIGCSQVFAWASRKLSRRVVAKSSCGNSLTSFAVLGNSRQPAAAFSRIRREQALASHH